MQEHLFEQIAARLDSILPQGLHQFRDEVESNLRQLLKESLSRLDLVTREEFDLQTEVLARTRAKVEALEKQVAELEKEL